MGSEARKRSREKLREQREKEKRASRRKKNLLVVGIAAAVVLLDPAAHVGVVHELVGDQAWTYADLAVAIGEVLGREVAYENLSEEDHRATLIGVGLDEATTGFVVGIDTGIREGELWAEPGLLAKLIGRPTTPIVETLRAQA